MVSTLLQDGPLFACPAGVAIPIGLPLLAVIGYFLWKDATRADSADGSDDDFDEPDGLSSAGPPDAAPGADSSAGD